jgi:multiple sugar transport system substrate-binding protein
VSRSRTLNRRQLLLGGAASAAALTGCAPRAERGPNGEKILTVWHTWGGVQAPRFEKVVRAYEQAHPDIKVRAVFTRNDLSSNQKFFTSIAAGTPPDVVYVDGPQVASWAEWGALEPLSDLIRSAGIRPDDYFAPTWGQCVYQDEVWALTYCADPNFGFAWNKDIFREAGLDPEKPPTTIEELTELAHRLSIVDGGVIRRIGLIPWEQYGPANSMFTWGWVFGGDFYDYAARRITADDPKVVKALEWMASFSKHYDPSRIQAMREGNVGGGDQDPFFTGRMAMRCLHIAGINDAARFAPEMDYGITFIPAPPGGEQRSSWVGGWAMGMPKGCRQPEEAWDFIRFLAHSPEGTSIVGRQQLVLPGMRRSPFFKEAINKPHYAEYVRILEESRHQRPVMPVQALYMREMLRAVEAAVYGRKSPAQALADARKNTQAELDLVYAG